MDEALERRLMGIIKDDLSACMDMLPARRVVLALVGGMARHLVPWRPEEPSSPIVGTVGTRVRRTLSQVASGVLVSA
jgi:hypothetical protein